MNSVKSIITPMYPVHQYMVIIRPSDAVMGRIKRIREQLKMKDGLQPYQLQGGFFLLARFAQFAMLEQRVIDKLRLIAMEATPFKAVLKDFQPVQHQSIGIGLTNPYGLQAIVNNMQRELRVFKGSGEVPFFNSNPSILLATKLQPEQFVSLSKAFQKKHLNASFVAGSMMLLRKAAGQQKWIIVEEMNFQNMPVFSKQGVLFA